MNTQFSISAPSPNEYHEYYHRYVSKFKADDFLIAFAKQTEELNAVLGGLDADEETKLHEPYTWTLKQVLGHLIDVERVFSTRMLRIAVGDETPIPGFDQNLYVSNMDYETVSMDSLLEEFRHLRNANVLLLERLEPEALGRVGTASDNSITARANLFILGGHVVYHLEIMKKRLGIEA
ncbi:MAG: DinB family protein [Mariniblastus sp.]